jgi:hypothetical protein
VRCLDQRVGSASYGAARVAGSTLNGSNVEARGPRSRPGADSARGCSTRASNGLTASRSFDSSRPVLNAAFRYVCARARSWKRSMTRARRCRRGLVSRSLPKPSLSLRSAPTICLQTISAATAGRPRGRRICGRRHAGSSAVRDNRGQHRARLQPSSGSPRNRGQIS